MEENNIIIYKDENNSIQIDVKMDGDMIWLTRQQLATLFGRDYKTISKHINNALKEELADEVVVAKFANTTQHGAIEGKIQTTGLEIQSPKIQTSGSEISHSADNRNHGVRNYQFVLPWAHYLILTHVSDPDARSFYEIEAFKQHTCGPYADDCRKPDRRERYNGKSSGKPDQPAELKEKGVSVWDRKNI